jgi:hypothetical protein
MTTITLTPEEQSFLYGIVTIEQVELEKAQEKAHSLGITRHDAYRNARITLAKSILAKLARPTRPSAH